MASLRAEAPDRLTDRKDDRHRRQGRLGLGEHERWPTPRGSTEASVSLMMLNDQVHPFIMWVFGERIQGLPEFQKSIGDIS
jgi:hypothetical protein